MTAPGKRAGRRPDPLRLEDLKNLGPKSCAWLREIGVDDLADLEARGAVDCYRQLRARGIPASLNLVYAIEAALQGLDWRELPPAEKEKLRDAIVGGAG